MNAADRGAIIVSLICLMSCILFKPAIVSSGIRGAFFVGNAGVVIAAWAYRRSA